MAAMVVEACNEPLPKVSELLALTIWALTAFNYLEVNDEEERQEKP